MKYYFRSFVMNVLVRLCTLLEFLKISESEEEKRDLKRQMKKCNGGLEVNQKRESYMRADHKSTGLQKTFIGSCTKDRSRRGKIRIVGTFALMFFMFLDVNIVVRGQPPSNQCSDTDNGAVDTYGDTCDDYWR